jgi:hypothetical protein
LLDLEGSLALSPTAQGHYSKAHDLESISNDVIDVVVDFVPRMKGEFIFGLHLNAARAGSGLSSISPRGPRNEQIEVFEIRVNFSPIDHVSSFGGDEDLRRGVPVALQPITQVRDVDLERLPLRGRLADLAKVPRRYAPD